MKRSVLLLLLLSFFMYSSCKSKRANSITVSYPPRDSLIRDKFLLCGECSSEKDILSVLIRIKNLDSDKEYEYRCFDIEDNSRWKFFLNEVEDGKYPLEDGNYLIELIAQGRYGKALASTNYSFRLDNNAPEFKNDCFETKKFEVDLSGKVLDENKIVSSKLVSYYLSEGHEKIVGAVDFSDDSFSAKVYDSEKAENEHNSVILNEMESMDGNFFELCGKKDESFFNSLGFYLLLEDEAKVFQGIENENEINGNVSKYILREPTVPLVEPEMDIKPGHSFLKPLFYQIDNSMFYWQEKISADKNSKLICYLKIEDFDMEEFNVFPSALINYEVLYSEDPIEDYDCNSLLSFNRWLSKASFSKNKNMNTSFVKLILSPGYAGSGKLHFWGREKNQNQIYGNFSFFSFDDGYTDQYIKKRGIHILLKIIKVFVILVVLLGVLFIFLGKKSLFSDRYFTGLRHSIIQNKLNEKNKEISDVAKKISGNLKKSIKKDLLFNLPAIALLIFAIFAVRKHVLSSILLDIAYIIFAVNIILGLPKIILVGFTVMKFLLRLLVVFFRERSFKSAVEQAIKIDGKSLSIICNENLYKWSWISSEIRSRFPRPFSVLLYFGDTIKKHIIGAFILYIFKVIFIAFFLKYELKSSVDLTFFQALYYPFYHLFIMIKSVF